MAETTVTSTRDVQAAARNAREIREAATQNARQQIDKARELREESVAIHNEKTNWKPTPTPDEIDILKLGGHIEKLEPDGSPEEGSPEHQRLAGGGLTAGYNTRQARPQQQPRQEPPRPEQRSRTPSQSQT